MKIILLDDVPKLGQRGEVRDVSDGYARNYLIPQRLALLASPGNLKNLESLKAGQESRATHVRSEADSLAQAIEALAYTEGRQASDEGRLFGSVGRADLSAFLAKHGLDVERRRVMLDEPIKTLGEFSVPIRLHPEVTAQLKVVISRE